MANTAFNAKFRIVDNNSDRENAPERNLIIDISVEEAMKMANWLQSMVDNAHVEDTTIRIYKSKSEYDKVAGFSIMRFFSGAFSLSLLLSTILTFALKAVLSIIIKKVQ